jgi:hypothetical protein
MTFSIEVNENAVFQGLWPGFRNEVGALSVREKPRPEHWQRKLFDTLDAVLYHRAHGPDASDPALIRRVIDEMQATAADWCMAGKLDEERAKAEFRRAIHKIFDAYPSADDGAVPSQADRTAELAREIEEDYAAEVRRQAQLPTGQHYDSAETSEGEYVRIGEY